MQALDMMSLPLRGVQLIEASAGTGKTYTLAGIYLRLLLGLGQSALQRPLSVEEILVVTFTDAATQELKERIRHNIQALRLACLQQQSSEPLYQQLLDQIQDPELAAALLLIAERQMDCAAIYTIHGFCQRVLQDHAFEVGLGFDFTILDDETSLQRQAVLDFWRSYCYRLSAAEMQVFYECWATPYLLLQELLQFLGRSMPEFNQPSLTPQQISEWHQDNFEAIQQLKSDWLVQVSDLEVLLQQAQLNRRSYSKKNLPNWLQKINQWSATPTTSFELPEELKRFASSTLSTMTLAGAPPRHALFTAIDELLQRNLKPRSVLLPYILAQVLDRLEQSKVLLKKQGFSDLLSQLDRVLQTSQGTEFAATIRQRYPVAMIDEFQDTDPQQYRIFKTIYHDQPDSAMILIGDPKQAIYAFRGGDIFTYLQAKQDIDGSHTLLTNWRASAEMVAAVNALFSSVTDPFLLQQINFHPVSSGYAEQPMQLLLNEEPLPALDLCLLSTEVIGLSRYREQMAQQCAARIADWLTLSRQQQAHILRGSQRRILEAKDIAILVRNQPEANLVSTALRHYGIASVYLSQRESVFATQEALDLYYVLEAVLAPQQEQRLRCALATELMGFSAQQLAQLDEAEEHWDKLTIEFLAYRQVWQQLGILTMLRRLLLNRGLAENLLTEFDGERRLTDLLHLAELLQEAASQCDTELALLRWYANQLQQPNHQLKTQQKRLEQEDNLVKIITFHKAKGLEYPVVCIPFACFYKEQAQALYHDRAEFALRLDLHGSTESWQLAEQERLAEDLRLLYVALTRAVYHCYVGIAPLNFSARSSKDHSLELHQTALGHLLQCSTAQQSSDFVAYVRHWAETHAVGFHLAEELEINRLPSLSKTDSRLASRHFSRELNRSWRITSYTGLTHSSTAKSEQFWPRFEMVPVEPALPHLGGEYSIHRFPKGAIAGTCLHAILERLDFSDPLVDSTVLLETLQLYGFEAEWAEILMQWLPQLWATPLNAAGLTLNQLSMQHKQPEFNFSFAIKKRIYPTELNAILQQEDPLSVGAVPLDFEPVEGILSGFIDLIFHWQGRYYLLDYKSNWLGESAMDYTAERIQQEMRLHRYDFQYQLYSLALHRYLQQRIVDYRYEEHFGGVFYLFLRGISTASPTQGIYFNLPSRKLIDRLDHLFAAGEDHDMVE